MFEFWFYYYHYNTGGGGSANNGYFKTKLTYGDKNEALKQMKKIQRAQLKKTNGSKIGEAYLKMFVDKLGIDGFFEKCIGVYEVRHEKIG